MERLGYQREEPLRVPAGVEVPASWGRADLHLHARDARSSLKDLLLAAKARGLDTVAVTEHDNHRNFQEVSRLGKVLGIQVIPGLEVTVLAPNPAHLLIYFPDLSCLPRDERIFDTYFARFVRADKAIQGAHQMEGVVIVPHPGAACTFSMGERYLLNLTRTGLANLYIDGLEILNSTIAGRSVTESAIGLWQSGGVGAPVGGSDARLPEHVGLCQTRFPGHSVEDFLQALKKQATVAEGNFLSFNGHLAVAGRQAETVLFRAKEKINNFLES